VLDRPHGELLGRLKDVYVSSSTGSVEVSRATGKEGEGKGKGKEFIEMSGSLHCHW